FSFALPFLASLLACVAVVESSSSISHGTKAKHSSSTKARKLPRSPCRGLGRSCRRRCWGSRRRFGRNSLSRGFLSWGRLCSRSCHLLRGCLLGRSLLSWCLGLTRACPLSLDFSEGGQQ